MADLWTFEVRYQRLAGAGKESAELVLGWKIPPATDRVKLVGELLPPVEVVSDRVVLPDLLHVGEAISQEMPVRIHDANQAGSIDVVCEPPVIHGSLNVIARRLCIVVHPDRAGRFSSRIRLVHKGYGIGELEVDGVAQ
jgi:hypothetical protein